MDRLRSLYESLGLQDVETYAQSGNVVFRTDARNTHALSKQIEDTIERKFGFQAEVILRTTAELGKVRNPFAGRRDMDPSKLLVTFLARDPQAEGRKRVLR
jgi:uncharacterized protein (DUF1697 family)